MNQNAQQFDDEIRAAFNQFSVEPSKQNWEAIDEQLSKQWFDKTLSIVLQQYESSPSPSLWNKIDYRHRQIKYKRISQVAAILLFGLLFFQWNNVAQIDEALAETSIQEKEEILAFAAGSDSESFRNQEETFVYSFDDTLAEEQKETVKILLLDEEEQKEKRLAALRSLIFEDDEDLFDNTDFNKINKILAPVPRLPFEAMAMLPPKHKKITYVKKPNHDIRIMIPLQIDIQD